MRHHDVTAEEIEQKIEKMLKPYPYLDCVAILDDTIARLQKMRTDYLNNEYQFQDE